MSGPDLSNERAARDRGARFVVGVDEVGRGPWAGPVVAGAVCLRGEVPPGLNDSKKLTAKRRVALAPLIEDIAHHAIGEASVEEIDALGIRKATHLAMERAVAALGVSPDHLLIDGNDRPSWASVSCQTIVGGDGVSASIAAASVLAKTWRDRGMVILAQQYPGYGWDRNMGYGTAEHREGLKCHGVTPHHRRSFAPIRNILFPPTAQNSP
ncbi:ribonuclease HII [Jannaschia aquimarina]|uniref:Ribonuclease HII n=1 Tax=Jannaschia aquimarina TaxID=935700 RepID=A0A0D1EDX1_9RHOB|nr:ribonuclease HII [Jannaschia aquimarina]KIT15131.1 Ribonuclease HII [Jannaschia aquimarina]SNS64918.1 RNase HII [Jannaschia aquimarina]